MNKILEFFVYSNLYLSLGAASVAYVSLLLLGDSFMWEPLLISFCSTFFLYNLNRKTDTMEDKINYPERVEFVTQHMSKLSSISLILYTISLGLALSHKILTVIIVITPLVLVVVYSVFRMKKIFLLKDVIVALGWSSIVFLVAVYLNCWTIITYLLALFIFSRVFITTVAFDIKDRIGDKVYGINTFPVKYGIKHTQQLLWSLNFILLAIYLILFEIFSLESIFYLLLLLNFYSSVYTWLLDKNINKIILYDIIVDGEYILLGVIMIMVSLL